VNVDGKGEHQITHEPQGTTADQPDWAPNGSRIIFTRCPSGGCSIWAVNPDGSHLQQVSGTCRGSQLPPPCIDDSAPAYSPDGRRIAFVRSTGEIKPDPVMGGQEIRSSALMIADAQGKRPRLVVPTKPFAAGLDGPVWSPDGKRLAFTRQNSGFSKPHGALAVFVVNADGTGLRRLTRWSMRGGDHPDWSPDGKRILFRSEPFPDSPGGNYYTVRPDGSGLKQLTHFASSTNIASASYSPDGKWIVFAKDGRSGLADVFIMKSNGSGIRPVTRTALWDSAPDWGSQGG
jgi:Tol biopolymer transport system component